MKFLRGFLFLAVLVSAVYLVYSCAVGVYGRILNAKLQSEHSLPEQEPAYSLTVITQKPDAETSVNIQNVQSQSSNKSESVEYDAAMTESEAITEPVISDDMRALYDLNSDTVGWLTVPDTNIDYVVCQTTDNDFYLHNSFEKKPLQSGTLFVDYRCDLNKSNIFIYGHKQADKSMFGTLTNYHSNPDFYKHNPNFEFSDLYRKYRCEIVSYFICPTTKTKYAEAFDFYNYIYFNEDYSFNNFADNIRMYSEIPVPNDISENDRFIILSTCSYEYSGARFVVIARMQET